MIYFRTHVKCVLNLKKIIYFLVKNISLWYISIKDRKYAKKILAYKAGVIMNKIINKLWILIILLFPVNVHAMTGGLSISCSPSTVRANGAVTCTITGTSDEVVSAVEAQITILNDKVTIASFSKDDVWATGNINTANYINVSTENSTIKDSFTVGTLSLRISGDANEPNDIRVNIQNVSFTDKDDNKISDGLTGGYATFSIEGQSEQQETPKGLKSLDVTGGVVGGDIIKNMAANVTLSSDTTSFGIVAVANNENDQIVCKNVDEDTVLNCGNIEFKTSGGKDSMNIHVEVGEGENLETYSLIVTKDIPATISDPELATLTVGGQTVALESGKIEGYTVTLENINNYLINWTLKDSDNYEVTNFTSNPTTHSGVGEFGITIEPKDKSSGLKSVTYSIRVDKAGGNPATQQPTQKPTPITNNPGTGGTSAAIMAIILFLSLGASIYFYQRNMSSYN